MDYPLPTNDISVSLVKSTLGVSTTNIGVLCTSPSINMWSKRKPVRDPRIDIPYSNVGRGSDGMYGLVLPPWRGDDTLLTDYAKPRGAGGQYSEPYRLGDFRGYFDDRTLPITILPQPDSIIMRTIEGTGFLSDVYTTPAIDVPVVTIQELDMQLCSFYCEHLSQSFIGWSPTLYFNFGGPNEQNVDVIFGLIPINQALSLNDWYTEPPGSGINVYELPRENITQNKNWINVPTVLPYNIVTNWNIIISPNFYQIAYSITANYSFVATIVVKEQESGTTILHFNVPVTANVPVSDSKLLDGPPYPIEPDKVYIGYIYDGPILLDSKLLSVG